MHSIVLQEKALYLPKEDIAVEHSGELSAESVVLAEKFSVFLIEIRPVLWSYLRTMIRDREAIEDCIQEASITIWENFNPNWEMEEFRPYAFTCARFKALNWLKKNKSRAVFLNPEIAAQVGEQIVNLSMGETASVEVRLRALDRCIETLPEPQQRIIRARYSKGSSESLSSLSRELSRPMTAIYKQLERLRTVLKNCMERKVDQLTDE